MSTVSTSVRVDEDLYNWFNEHFPWRGSLPQFFNAALGKFREQWGDRPTPDQVLAESIKRLSPRYAGRDNVGTDYGSAEEGESASSVAGK